MQSKLKLTQPLPVRFGHSPCVKLTLSVRPAPATRLVPVRVLRLDTEARTDRPRFV
jgi:hypothetical protein